MFYGHVMEFGTTTFILIPQKWKLCIILLTLSKTGAGMWDFLVHKDERAHLLVFRVLLRSVGRPTFLAPPPGGGATRRILLAVKDERLIWPRPLRDGDVGWSSRSTGVSPGVSFLLEVVASRLAALAAVSGG